MLPIERKQLESRLKSCYYSWDRPTIIPYINVHTKLILSLIIVGPPI